MRRTQTLFILAVSGLTVFLEANCTKPSKLWTEVSGEKAFAHVQQLVDLGPRPAGSETLEKSRQYIEKELSILGWKVTRQTFTTDTPRGPIQFVNLIARFGEGGSATPFFLLCSHYDTKFFENEIFVGANDGGSSTALLLELARVLSTDPGMARKVELVFFDGEEAFENFSETDGLYGSRYFARQLSESDRVKHYRGGIVFDMIGDKSLTVTMPPDSSPRMARGIFDSAEALKLRNYFTYFSGGIMDDHTPLNQVGLPTIDLIDFDFAAWHTPEDKIDKVSPESLRIVGSVAVYYLSQFGLR